MRVVCFTSDRTQWALQPFAYLFNLFWSSLQVVDVAGYTVPPFRLPTNFRFTQIAPRPYPPQRFTDGVIEYLYNLTDDVFVLMFDDYWLCRGVDHQAIASLADYLTMHPEVIRIDLTADRLYAGDMRDVESWGRLDIVETPASSPYQMSTQCCLVNRRNLLAIIKPGLTPWEFELQGNDMLGDKYRVLGTRQYPVRYANGIGTGHGEDGWTEGIPLAQVAEMIARGYFPRKRPG